MMLKMLFLNKEEIKDFFTPFSTPRYYLTMRIMRLTEVLT